MATLIAKTRIKFGSQGRPGLLGTVADFKAGKTVMPGETFEVEGDLAKQFIEDGTAMTQADARAKEREGMDAEAKLREAEEDARKAGLHFTPATFGTAGSDRNIEAHREEQEREEAAVAEATGKKTPAKAKS